MGIRSAAVIAVSSYAVVVLAGPVLGQQSTPVPSGAGKNAGTPSSSYREPVRREVAPLPKQGAVKKRGTGEASGQGAPAPQAAGTGQAAGAAPATGSAPRALSLPAAAGLAPGPAPAAGAGWSEVEIKEALARCTGLLKGVSAVYELEDPIKDGACGSPAVYKLSSIGKGPAVDISPPVSITCDMIVSLEKWMRTDVQPKARAMLAGPIVKIDTMSSYSCRNAYGRARTKLSEHGRANAIDIGAFATARDSVSVLADWGLTVREHKAIAAKQEADRAAAAAAAAASKQTQPGALPQVPGTMAPLPGTGQMIRPPGGSIGFNPPNRLGGPKPQPTPTLPTLPNATQTSAGSAKRNFIRDIHASACKHFGTVLGPEANNAHKNHFHLDMAPRRLNNFCE